MKKTISRKAVPSPARAKRLNVSEAKAKLSQALRELEGSPTIIHNRGRDVAALISMDDYERLLRAAGSGERADLRSFLDAIDELKREFGGGTALPIERVAFAARDPFGRRRS